MCKNDPVLSQHWDSNTQHHHVTYCENVIYSIQSSFIKLVHAKRRKRKHEDSQTFEII